MREVHLLDYVAGNVTSLANAIEKLGYTVVWVQCPEDIENAQVKTETEASTLLHNNAPVTVT